LNIVDSCLKPPIPSPAADDSTATEKPALIFQRHGSNALESWNTATLAQWVNRVASRLAGLFGTSNNCRIAVCLPLTPESVAVYLAIIKAGHTVVSIADSFAPDEIAIRCEIANVTAIFTQDVILRPNKAVPLYTRVVDAVESLSSSSRKKKKKQPEEEEEDEKEHKEEDDHYDDDDVNVPVKQHDGTATTGNDDKSRRTIPIIVLPALLGSQQQQHHDTTPLLQVSLDRRRPCDVSWADFLASGGDSTDEEEDVHFTSVVCDSMAPCNILFSSGTTGEPKAIVWTHATLIKSAVDGYYHQNLNEHDVICWPTSLGWMMGSWLIAQRINRVTIALPCVTLPHDWPSFTNFLHDAGVTMLGVIPSLVSVWYAQYNEASSAAEEKKTFRLPDSITRYSSTGEASDPLVYHWLMSRKRGYAPIIEYCGGTEIGGSFLSSVLCLPNVASHFNTPVMGCELALLHPETHQVLDLNNDNDDIDIDEVRGELVLVPPTVGYSTVLLNRDHDECYFDGMPEYRNGQRLRRHGDAFCQTITLGDDDATTTTLYRALGRCDDTMNLGGIKVSSVELERVCNDAMSEICDCAAIAIGHPSKLVVYAVVVVNTNSSATTRREVVLKTLQQSIKERLNPLFHLRDVVLVDSLPRTASNKVMRRLLRDEYMKQQQQTIAVAAV
jgi:acyl-coenzyme A synthetase/AMP-(fatty) acid ligase